MSNKTLGMELIEAIEGALDAKEAGKMVRPCAEVSQIRHELNLTQKEFAKRYHINVETLRNWEQHKRTPDMTSLAYLTCIAKRPRLIEKLLGHGQ
ncbi:MAG TPA: helix-turn-helix domain-containing protein [Gammaproteobacteria bacterium]|nr:helix-turn-helix domain-containing protein [Gammaproteobacteria bacterium]